MISLTTLRTILLAAGLAAPLPAQRTVLRAGRLLDPVSGVARPDQTIVVEHGRIVAVGAGLVPAPGDRVVDLGAYTVLPGLIDAHVHLSIGGPPRRTALADLAAGFTTVVDLGARGMGVLRLRDSINAGRLSGPRILAAGRWVGVQGGVCEFNGIGVAGGAEAFRERVRENVAAGADLIKACVTGWPAQAWAAPDNYEMPDSVLAAIVAEARRLHRPVIVHDLSLGGVRAGLRAGVTGLAHAAYLDSATAGALRERGVFLTPTLASLTAGDSSAAAGALATATRLAWRAGVRLVFGTDAGVLPHGRNAEEFRALVRAGVPLLEAIRAATIGAAQAYGLADSLGTIAPAWRPT